MRDTCEHSYPSLILTPGRPRAFFVLTDNRDMAAMSKSSSKQSWP
jgi:hypothetical protein